MGAALALAATVNLAFGYVLGHAPTEGQRYYAAVDAAEAAADAGLYTTAHVGCTHQGTALMTRNASPYPKLPARRACIRSSQGTAA